MISVAAVVVIPEGDIWITNLQDSYWRPRSRKCNFFFIGRDNTVIEVGCQIQNDEYWPKLRSVTGKIRWRYYYCMIQLHIWNDHFNR